MNKIMDGESETRLIQVFSGTTTNIMVLDSLYCSGVQ